MKNVEEVEVAQAQELLASGCVFVDVRDAASYESAHIPGAIHMTDASVGAFIAASNKDTAIVVYCYHGHSSLGGAAYFMENGFKKAYSLAGGFESWRRSAATTKS